MAWQSACRPRSGSGDDGRSTESRCHWKILLSGLAGSVNRDAVLSPTSGAAMSRRFTSSTRSDTSGSNSAAVSGSMKS